jgi:hypothetical protein
VAGWISEAFRSGFQPDRLARIREETTTFARRFPVD